MESVSTRSTSQDYEYNNQLSQAHQLPYQNTYTSAIIVQFTHPSKSNSNTVQMIKLSAKGSNPEEDQMDKLEQILIQLKVPYKINNEIRTFALDDSHYKQSQDKIQELFFKPHKDGESLLQILLSED